MKKIRRRLLLALSWFRPLLSYHLSIDIPGNIKENKIYIIGENKNQWLIIFVCPCGCKEIIHLNLLVEAKPCWKYKITRKNKITLYPSIWRTTGCKSHFIIRSSRICWVDRWE